MTTFPFSMGAMSGHRVAGINVRSYENISSWKILRSQLIWEEFHVPDWQVMSTELNIMESDIK